MRGFPRLWNDWLALIIIVGTPALWVFAMLPETVLGTTLAAYMLVVQYYFRKAPDAGGGEQ